MARRNGRGGANGRFGVSIDGEPDLGEPAATARASKVPPGQERTLQEDLLLALVV